MGLEGNSVDLAQRARDAYLLGVCACMCMWARAYLRVPACAGLCVMAYALVCLCVFVHLCVDMCVCVQTYVWSGLCLCVCAYLHTWCVMLTCVPVHRCVWSSRECRCMHVHTDVFVCMVHVLVSCIHVCMSALCLRVHVYRRGTCSFVYTCACVHACVCTRVHACVSACVCWKQGVLSPFLSCPSPPVLLQLVPLLFRTLLRDQVPRREPP